MLIKVTVDVSANMKLLKQLQQKGLIEVHVISIENHKTAPSLRNKHLPTAVIGNSFSPIGSSVIARDNSQYQQIQDIIGKQHRADALHLEGHIESEREIFVTEDTDFLNKRTELEQTFSIKIHTPTELCDLLLQ